jgi:hypothetical protein
MKSGLFPQFSPYLIISRAPQIRRQIAYLLTKSALAALFAK